MRQVVRVAGLVGLEGGEFGGDGLADEHRPGGTRQRHATGIVGRLMARIDGRAIGGGHAGGGDQVLDADRQAMQQALVGASIECARTRQSGLAVHMAPGLYLALTGIDARQAVAYQIFGAQAALGQLLGRLASAQQVVCHRPGSGRFAVKRARVQGPHCLMGDCLADGGNMLGRGAAAAANDVDQPFGGEFMQ